MGAFPTCWAWGWGARGRGSCRPPTCTGAAFSAPSATDELSSAVMELVTAVKAIWPVSAWSSVANAPWFTMLDACTSTKAEVVLGIRLME